ncbi:MAG: hypothetical protein QM775_08230 [Pirellulales bacterium]
MSSFKSYDELCAFAHSLYIRASQGDRDVKWMGPEMGVLLSDPRFRRGVLDVVETDGDASRTHFGFALDNQDPDSLGVLFLAMLLALGDFATEHESNLENRKAA